MFVKELTKKYDGKAVVERRELRDSQAARSSR